MLPGLMQESPLTLDWIFRRMATVHADSWITDYAEGEPPFQRTYGEVAERVLRLARVLRDDLGVRPGDRVATFGFNGSHHLELYWAVPLVGAVLHTVNVRLYGEQVAAILNHAENRVLFTDAALAETIAEVAPQVPSLQRVLTMGDESLIEGVDPLALEELPPLDERQAMGLCYTSGTTGMPKGVLYSHRAMVLHSYATNMAAHLGLVEADVVFPVVPMFHAFGWSLPYAAPMVGANLVTHGADSTPARLGRIIERERVTVTAGVPTIWKTLLPEIRSGELDVSSLRTIGVGGSASPRALIEAYHDLGIGYLQIWGMTETGPLACVSVPRRRHEGLDRGALMDVREKTGTIFAGLEARVADMDTGEPLAWDGQTVGELEVRGPWIASGYYAGGDTPGPDPEAAEKFHDGWLRTGDMAWMEHDGYFRIVDRAKDLVKSGGEWISSVELEGHLLAHPAVADAAVVGITSRRWDERPCAVIVPADPANPPTLDELKAFLADRVAKWWLPDAIEVVDDIPKTSVGKIDKKVLRAQLDHVVVD